MSYIGGSTIVDTFLLFFVTAPSPLETKFSFFITGSSVEVCVETKQAAIIKLILRDAEDNRQVAIGEFVVNMLSYVKEYL